MILVLSCGKWYGCLLKVICASGNGLKEWITWHTVENRKRVLVVYFSFLSCHLHHHHSSCGFSWFVCYLSALPVAAAVVTPLLARHHVIFMSCVQHDFEPFVFILFARSRAVAGTRTDRRGQAPLPLHSVPGHPRACAGAVPGGTDINDMLPSVTSCKIYVHTHICR